MRLLSLHQLNQAVAILRVGGVVAYPTETSYALGCDATNARAVEKIFQIKGRVGHKSFLIIVESVRMAKKYLRWNNSLRKIAQKYWPGAVTAVGEYRRTFFNKKLALGVIAKDGSVAIRVSAAKVPKFFAVGLGRPVVATSANLAGAGDIYNSADLIAIFSGRDLQPDAVVDAGSLPKCLPTTIISVIKDNVRVLRDGEIKISFY